MLYNVPWMALLKTYSCYLLILACLLVSNAVTAQVNAGKYYVAHFGEEEGLPQNTINNLLPDKNGFLWIATESGICRFNGNHFLPVAIKAEIGTTNFSRIKNFYYKGKDTIIAYSAASSIVAIIVNNTIVSLESASADKQGLLFGAQHIAIPAPHYITKDSGNTLKQWDIAAGTYNGCIYNKDTIVVTLSDGFGFYDSKGQISKIKINDFNVSRALYVNQRPVYADANNYLHFYSPAGTETASPVWIPIKQQLRFYNNSFGKGFFCTADSVLYNIDIAPSQELIVRKIFTNLHDANDIRIIYEKDNNTVVTGTSRNGMFIYKRSFFSVSDPLPAGEPDVFYTQRLLPDNETLLVGKDKLFKGVQFVGKTNQPFITHDYSSLKDSKGYYWYVKQDHLFRAKQIGVDAETMLIFKQYPGMLFEDRQQNVWFSSTEKFGYFQNGQFNELKINGLNTGSITYLQQDATGRYLIGTSKGLFILNNINETSLHEVQALSDVNIRFIWPEANGQIWVCTYGDGIFLIAKNNVVRFPESKGRLAYVHCIVEDDNGFFWMPSNNGLFVTSRRSLMAYVENNNKTPFYYLFTKKNGLRTNEFNGGAQPAFLRLPNGVISFPSMQGLVQFDPNNVGFNFSPTEISIDNIQLDSADISQQEEFDVKDNIGNISFTISNSFWGEKENELLEYQVIEKGDTREHQWLPIDASGKINLFSPSHGDYSLIIRKRIGLNENDYLHKTINFHVLPKWYQTKLFLFAVLIGIALLIMAALSLRKNYYRKANKVMKEKVEAATAELQQMNNTLEKKVEERTLAIQQAEMKFRDLVEKSLVGVYIIKDGKFAYVNPRFAEIFGRTQKELTDAPTVDIVVYEPDRKIVANNIKQRMSGEVEGVHYEVRGEKKDGTVIYTELFGRTTQFEGGPAIIGTLLDITAKKIAEEQLIKEKDLSQSIINNLPGIFYIFDQSNRHLLWNKNFETISGYSTEEIAAAPAGSLTDEKGYELLQKAIKRVYAEGYAEEETTLLTKDGRKLFYYYNGILVNYNDKPCVLGVGIDITQRQKAEQERERANYMLNERIKELTTLYRAGVVLQQEDRSIVVTLHDFVSLLPQGWQYPSITAARVTLGEMEFTTPNFKEGKANQAAALNTTSGTTGKIEVVYLEDKPKEFEGPFLEEERKLIDMLADMLRIYLTKREAIEALQKSEANLHTVFDTTDTVYALLNENCQIIAFNQRAADFSQREFKQPFVLHNRLVDYFPEERKADLINNLEKVKAGSHINYEISYPQADGSFNWYSVRMFPITNPEKKVFGMMMALSDITETKRLEQEILDQKVQEQKAVIRAILLGEERERNKIGQELHDNVNQILAGTRLYLSTARKSTEGKENNVITESMDLIDSAIDEIRALSKGKVTPMKSVNLEQLLQVLLDSLASTTSIQTNLIYKGPGQLIEDDLKLNIYRIIQEQLNNVVKHAEAKNATVLVDVGINNILVSVTDDGKGFDPKMKKDGIGISNMINRVESFNGTIEINSSPGNGCSIIINLPY